MFSFHKPKIYRSNLGCCICKAKSSSSRFTDSKKYENEFERCFRIQEKRSGEICNACVLLVKRWKKLSLENKLTKHWHHVVDARAGPGTKLTGNRRLVASSSSTSTSGSHCDSIQEQQKHQSTVSPLSASQANNQSTGQSSAFNGSTSSSSNSAGRKRGGSFSKARAIDTNVSTFTFGEPVYRRSYMTTETSFSPSNWSTCSSSSLAKPQSALNSSAFESVIKRYRQRQQQQQLEAQRRILNKQQRQNKRQLEGGATPIQPNRDDKQQQINTEETVQVAHEQQPVIEQLEEGNPVVQVVQQTKRLKRSSESIGALSIDGLRVASLLDSSLWRKEKICCGIIFRGPHDEVVVFPKLLKPCQWRMNKKLEQQQQEKLATLVATNHEDENLLSGAGELQPTSSPPPPSRTAKSGSISSCDSNTSGTGSMEQPVEERVVPEHESVISRLHRTTRRQLAGGKSAESSDGLILKAAANRQRAQPVTRRRQQQHANSRKLCANDLDSNTSSSSSSVLSSLARSANIEAGSRKGSLSSTNSNPQEVAASSPASSSGASSLRVLQMAGSEVDDEFDDEEEMADEEDENDDDEEEEEEEEEELIGDEDVESNTDASSSVDSLAEVERKKSTSHVVGAMG